MANLANGSNGPAGTAAPYTFSAPQLLSRSCWLAMSRSMPRLSIDITTEEHQKLKAIAALRGQSIKEFVLTRTLGDAPALDDMTEQEAFGALNDFLRPRIDQTRRELSTKSVADIRCEARAQKGDGSGSG